VLRLGILDQSPIAEGSTGADALRNTLDLAELTDRLGYHRYWLAEHHGGPMLAGPSPEVLIGPIAERTRGIRVGSGGVMLPHYSPFKVAESFSVLSALYPGRVDLGLGRAAGTDPLTTFALQRDRRQAAPDDFPQQLVELLAHLEDALPEDHPFKRLAGFLPGAERPELWLLGSSAQSGIWAAELGLPYSFADFINPHGAEIAQRYRREFVPSARLDEPLVSVGVWALAADTEEEAERLASSARMTLRLLRRGALIAVPPPEKALPFLEQQGPGRPSERRRRGIVGTPDRVRERVEQVAAEYGADEAIILTITHDHSARRRSYELVAEAFGLERRPSASVTLPTSSHDTSATTGTHRPSTPSAANGPSVVKRVPTRGR
jgi:luciferase family oxidoreductase group 1